MSDKQGTMSNSSYDIEAYLEPSEELVLDDNLHCGFGNFIANLSVYDFPNPQELSRPVTGYDYTKICLYFAVLLVALAGNVSVILTVAFNRSMRTTINVYLVNLAAADLLICGFCMWVPLVNSLTTPMFVLGAFMCKFNPFSQMTCLTSSVLTLSAISCDRFVAIMFPLHARITKQRTGLIISAIWVVAALVALPFLIFNEQVIIEWRDIIETHCTDKWPRDETWDPVLQTCIVRYPTKKIYYTFVALTLYFLPVAIMTVAYFLIVWKLRKTKAPGERNIANIVVQHRAKKKVIKMVCVVLLGFVVCWTPMQVTVLYSQYGHSNEVNGTLPEWFETFAYFSIFLAYSNSAINPILYGGFNANFRKGFAAVLKCDYTQDLRMAGSRRSRMTMSTGFTATVSSGRFNGTSPKEFELKTVNEDSLDAKGKPVAVTM